jgi:hypothetical protein
MVECHVSGDGEPAQQFAPRRRRWRLGSGGPSRQEACCAGYRTVAKGRACSDRPYDSCKPDLRSASAETLKSEIYFGSDLGDGGDRPELAGLTQVRAAVSDHPQRSTRVLKAAVAKVLDATANEGEALSCLLPTERTPMISGSPPSYERSAAPDSPGTEPQLTTRRLSGPFRGRVVQFRSMLKT